MTKQELEQCIDAYGRDIFAFCKHLACNQQEAEDLYQDTFLKAVELGDRIAFAGNPKSYFLSITLRIWKNRKRKFAWRKRIADVRLMVEDDETAETSSEAQVIRKVQYEAVRQAVEKLPERYKIPVLLFYMEELSTPQIAAIMQIPKGTVLSRLHQARKLLRKELENVLDENEFG